MSGLRTSEPVALEQGEAIPAAGIMLPFGLDNDNGGRLLSTEGAFLFFRKARQAKSAKELACIDVLLIRGPYFLHCTQVKNSDKNRGVGSSESAARNRMGNGGRPLKSNAIGYINF